MIGVPLVVAVGSQVAFSAGRAPWYLVLSVGFLLTFAVIMRVALAWLRPRADPFWQWSCLGGAWVLGAVLFLGAVAFRGPLAYWLRFWTDETARGRYLTVAVGLLIWWLAAIVVGLADGYDLKARQATGAVLVGLGVPLTAVAAVLATVGLERSLTTLNDELALLPLGLSRILGLTVHLGIPPSLPAWLGGTGIVLGSVGWALTLGGRRGTGRKRRARRRPTGRNPRARRPAMHQG